jgi:hypothetical protein
VSVRAKVATPPEATVSVPELEVSVNPVTTVKLVVALAWV